MKKQLNEGSDKTPNITNDLLFQRIWDGDPTAENELLNAYHPQIEKLVHSFLSHNNISIDHDITDYLMNAARMGIHKAAQSYDSSRSVAFMTYAYNFIRFEIVSSYKEYCEISHISQREYKYIKAMRAIIVNRQKEGLANPNIEEIASELSLSISDAQYIYELNQEILDKQNRKDLFSISKHADKNSDETSSHYIGMKNANHNNYSPSIELVSTILRDISSPPTKLIKTIIEETPEPDKSILLELMLHPNLESNKTFAYSDVAERHKKSQRTIKKIETRFLRNVSNKLKKQQESILHPK